MQWEKKYLYLPQYEFTSCNQHGSRFKRNRQKQCSVANISCKQTDVNGMKNLILLSDTLDVPVRYDFDEQMAYIEVVSGEVLKRYLT